MKNTLLVIEDEPLLANLFKMVGEDIGFDVLLADDLKSIEHVLPISPSVIMMDLILPSTDPNAVFQRLIDSKCDAQLIIMSGTCRVSIENAVQEAKQLGLKSCFGITKPIDLEQLTTILGRLHAS